MGELATIILNALILNKKIMMSSIKIQRRTKGFFKKKNKKKTFYSMYNNESSEAFVEVLFMGVENKVFEEEVEGMVDIEAELISSFEELRKYKRMYKKSQI